MRLRTRLARLEGKGPEGGCPACRERRGLTVLVTVREDPDGTAVFVQGGPLPCPLCGRVPEQVVEVMETVVAQPAAAGTTEAPSPGPGEKWLRARSD
jgi:hypothetical protein